MALIFMDSVNHYSTGTLSQKYATSTNVGITASGRHGNGLTGFTSAAWSVQMPLVAIATGNAAIMGASVNAVTYPSGTGRIFALAEWQVYLECTATGALAIFDSSGVKVTSAAAVLTAATFVNVEFTVNHATLVATAFVNGISVATTTVLTNGTTLSTVTMGDIGNVFSNGLILDDLYVADNTGAFFNSPKGTWQIYLAPVNANGRVNQWTPLSGNNSSSVNQVPPPGNAAYVSANTVSLIDDYKLLTPTGLSLVAGVQVVGSMSRDASGSRTVALGVGSGTAASEKFDAGHVPPQSTYQMFTNCLSSNPITTVAWAVTDLTTLQASIKLTA